MQLVNSEEMKFLDYSESIQISKDLLEGVMKCVFILSVAFRLISFAGH